MPPERFGAYLREFDGAAAPATAAAGPTTATSATAACTSGSTSTCSPGRASPTSARSWRTRPTSPSRTAGRCPASTATARPAPSCCPACTRRTIIGAFEEFKGIWDPDGRLNPGRVVRPAQAGRGPAGLRRAAHPGATRRRSRSPHDRGSFARRQPPLPGRRASASPRPAAVMCPSFRATGEEQHSTRGRARLLFEMANGEVIEDGWRSDRGGRGARPVPVVQGLQARLPGRGGHGHLQDRVPRPALPRAAAARRRTTRWARCRCWLWLVGQLPPRVVDVLNAAARGPLGRGGEASGRDRPGARDPRAGPRPRAAAPPGGAGLSGRRAPGGTGRAPPAAAAMRTAAGAPRCPPTLPRCCTAAAAAPAATGPAAVAGDGGCGRPRRRTGSGCCCGPTPSRRLRPRRRAGGHGGAHQLGYAVELPPRTRLLRADLDDHRAGRRRPPGAAPQPRRRSSRGSPRACRSSGWSRRCTAALRADAAELLPDDPLAARLAGGVRTFAEVLAEHADALRGRGRRPRAAGRWCRCTATSTRSWASRPTGPRMAALGIEAEVLDSGCCGLAGNFGFEKGHYAVSMACAERVLLPGRPRRRPGRRGARRRLLLPHAAAPGGHPRAGAPGPARGPRARACPTDPGGRVSISGTASLRFQSGEMAFSPS